MTLIASGGKIRAARVDREGRLFLTFGPAPYLTYRLEKPRLDVTEISPAVPADFGGGAILRVKKGSVVVRGEAHFDINAMPTLSKSVPRARRSKRK